VGVALSIIRAWSAYRQFTISVSKGMRWQRFWRGFVLIVGAAAIFNVLSLYHAWFPDCGGCLMWGGAPFPFVQHGSLYWLTFVSWTGIRDDLIAIAVVAVLGGLVAMRLFRSAP
jgi:hypothetical protein